MRPVVVFVGPQDRSLDFLAALSAQPTAPSLAASAVVTTETIDESTLADDRIELVVVDPTAEFDQEALVDWDGTVLTTAGSGLAEPWIDERVAANGDAAGSLAAAVASALHDRTSKTDSREAQLKALREAIRSLIVAETSEVVAEETVTATESILGGAETALWTCDETEERLVPAVTRGDGRPEPITPPDDQRWRLFERDEFRLLEDPEFRRGGTGTERPSTVVAPLGDRGLLITDAASSARSTGDIELIRILASAAGAALARTERERELKRQNERLDQFTSVVSHDLKTPIQLAVSQLELYRETGTREHLDALADAHDRMETLVDDLLALARQGDTVDSIQSVTLSRVATSAWDGIESDRATLQIVADGTVEADPGRLEQLFSNLFTNALDHRESESATISVGVLPDAPGFFVADDGPGIPPVDREAVFERGYTTSDEGTGFGLAIVAEIVDAHGWSITITDSDAGGARFEVSGVSVAD